MPEVIESQSIGGFPKIKGLDAAVKQRDDMIAGREPEPTKVEVKPIEEPKVEAKPEVKTEPKTEVTPDKKVEPRLNFKPPQEQTHLKKSDEWEAARRASYEKGLKDAEEKWNKDKENLVAKAELESALKELNDYKSRLQAVALEQDPVFQREIGLKQQAAINLAKNASPEHAEQIEKLMRMPPSSFRDEALENVISELPGPKQARVMAALGQLEQVENEKADRLSRAQQELSSRIQNSRQQMEQDQALTVKAFNDAWAAETDPSGPLAAREGDTEWDAMIQQVNKMAQQYFIGEKDRNAIARACIDAAEKPLLLKDLAILHQTNAELKAEIERLRGTQPNPVLTGGTSKPKSVSKSSGVSPFSEGVASITDKLQQAMNQQSQGF